jgi:hypothetical protein
LWSLHKIAAFTMNFLPIIGITKNCPQSSARLGK